MIHCMRDWHHAPLHRFGERNPYIITAGTYGKKQFFSSPEKLSLLLDLLFEFSNRYEWQLDSWSVFSNHYHFVGSPAGAANSLRQMLDDFHSAASRELNKLDGALGRKVWFQYWDTELTFERSYLARLNYVLQNPVRHRLVKASAPAASRYSSVLMAVTMTRGKGQSSGGH